MEFSRPNCYIGLIVLPPTTLRWPQLPSDPGIQFRPIPASQLHLTIAYLDWLNVRQQRECARWVREHAVMAPSSLSFTGRGSIIGPDGRQTFILDVAMSAALDRLRQQFDSVPVIGEFHPHVSVARVAPGFVGAAEWANLWQGTVNVAALALMEGVPSHETVAVMPVGGQR